MTRQARLESPTGYYHIMVRGINKDKIFKTEKEKEKIISIIKEKIREEPCQIAAYCIMDNHLHMIIICEKSVLTNVMRRINISYAMSYNRKHKRIGPVFQERFKSEGISDERYLYGAIRYIHNNPVKGHITSKAEEYKWSSMREYINKEGIILIDKDIKQQVLNGFLSDKEFMEFHNLQDEEEYLDMKEEIDDRKEKEAEEIMNVFFQEKGITDSKQFHNKEELIIKLLDETKLSYRKIAELTESSLNKVYTTNKKYRA